MANTHLFLSAFTSILLAAAVNGQISKKVHCEEAPLDVIFLVDTNARNVSDFEQQQNKIADIIRHLEKISTSRDTLYSVVAFHRRPVILLSVVSPSASNPEKVLEHVRSLSARSKFDSSPAKALDLAAEQFANNARPTSKRLVVMAHDGVSTDLIAETLEARNSLERNGAAIFAITSTEKPNLPALTGYTLDRTHVFATGSDRDVFFEEMERAIGACTHLSEASMSNKNNNTSMRPAMAFGVRTREVESAQESEKSRFEGECKANKIDLIIVLDTSGSVFNAFADERKLAADLIRSLAPETLEDGRLQVSVVRFSSSATIKIPFDTNQTADEIVEKLDEIKFTGYETRIARALDLALEELSRARRDDAIQVLILISDGYGQEFWHVVQMASKKLQSADAEVFAVSTSRDYNLAELTLYTGDEKRVYVGAQHHEFIPTIAPLMNKCMRAESPQLYVTRPTTTTGNLKVLEIDSTASMNTTLETSSLTSTVSKAGVEEQLTTQVTPSKVEVLETLIDGGRIPSDEAKSSEEQGISTGALQEVPAADMSGTTGGTQNELLVEDYTTTKKPATEVAPASAGNPDLVALADSFEDLNSNTELRSPPNVKASPSLKNPLQKVKLDEDLKTELTVNKASDEGKVDGTSVPKVIELPPRRPAGGNLDLLFAIDRSPDSPVDLMKQLKLATELVDELTDEDISEGRVRVAIISFAQDARVDLEWDNATTKAQILQPLTSIEFTSGNTSAVAGIKLATQYAQMARRPNTRLMIILISDGNSQDLWHSVMETAKKLHELPDTVIYAVTTSKQYTFIELEAFTGDKWKVYVDARTSRFVADAGKQLIDGANGNDETSSDATPSPQTTTVPKNNGLVDLIFLLDKSTTADDDFEASKKALEKLLRSVPASDFKSRIRVALITFTDKARTEIELRKPTTRDDILYAVERAQNKGGETSVPAALNAALLQISVPRGGTVRLVFVMLTDGGSRDSAQVVNATATKLHRTGAEVYMIPITGNYSTEELLQYAGDPSRLLTMIKGHEQRFADYVNLNGNKPVRMDVEKLPEKDKLSSKMSFEEQTHATSGPDLGVEAPATSGPDLGVEAPATSGPDLGVEAAAQNELNTALSDFDFPFAASTSKAQPGNPNCEVDLMFIIDKSQSVENAFQRQLQFAVALVKRIPPSDFETRVRVAAVSFNSRAQIDFRFDEFNNQTEILDALLSIKHTGGSTSAVSGVNLAVGEIRKTGRKGARKMIVLISDGNSQDRWEDLLDAADRLRATDVTVYAVTASHQYYFRELELYAGNKWLVYVDARKRQFLNDAELSLLQCQSPSAPVSSLPPREKHVKTSFDALSEGREEDGRGSSISACKDDSVDLLFIIDTSTSVEYDFYKEKSFATDLIKVIPLEDFPDRIAVAVVQFNDTGRVQFGFGKQRTRGDVLYEMERLERTGGRTSIVAGADAALREIAKNHRPSARLVIVIVSDGNSQDMWQLVQKSARKLRKTGGEIYAVTLSKEHNASELKEYAGNATHLYTGKRVNSFIEDVGGAILNCNSSQSGNKVPVTVAPSEMVHVTPPSESVLTVARTVPKGVKQTIKEEGPVGGERGIAAAKLLSSNDLARDEKPVIPARDSKPVESKRCKYSKMDLEIILDASTSRQQVFEHQRELALSLIERLPIDAGETHVAVGINSFTSVPTLRQTLGLGRDKQMVRHAIEDIKYNGGSTFTAQAVELSVQDLERGRRPDAIQVVVLMNDGMSQDPWEKVLEASERLRATGAELFGVALGEKIDLRELRHYIGSEDRIYRDNSTERFLTDVVSLLTGGQECGIPSSVKLGDTKASEIGSSNQICNTPNLDIVILFDNADETANLSDPSISSNRYLLLDVLGSLPVTEDADRVKISVITFNSEPRVVVSLSDKQDRDAIFTKVESIEAEAGKPSYAKAVNLAVQEYNKGRRSNARGMLVIVGDGQSDDTPTERDEAAQHLHSVKGLDAYAVDSGKLVDVNKLSEYTGSSNNVYNYDRNAEFAKVVFGAALAADKARCPQVSQRPGRFTAVNNAARESNVHQKAERKKDVPNKVVLDLKQFEGEKVIVKEQTTTTGKVRTPRPTTKPPKRITTTTAGEKVTIATSTSKTSTTIEEDEAQKVEKKSEEEEEEEQKVTRIRSTRPPISSRATTPTRANFNRQNENTIITTTTPGTTTVFSPGCEIDAIIIIDSSGSVEETFGREKELAAGIINRLRIGPNNARVAIIKFAAKEKVKTVWSFDRPQEQQKVLQALQEIPFSSGTTAIHTALLQAITEYSSTRGARPGQATPFAIIFTDGFGQKDTTEAATLLRNLIPNMYAVAINRQYPISEPELIRIAGSKDRVYTDENIDELYRALEKITRTC